MIDFRKHHVILFDNKKSDVLKTFEFETKTKQWFPQHPLFCAMFLYSGYDALLDLEQDCYALHEFLLGGLVC